MKACQPPVMQTRTPPLRNENPAIGNAPDPWWGQADSPFGRVHLSARGDAVSALRFLAHDSLGSQESVVAGEQDNSRAELLCNRVFSAHGQNPGIPLLLRGTPFQIQVWEALQALPPGIQITYRDLASLLWMPRSVRAVASAVARNPVAILVPCHRVVPATGGVGRYRWGAGLKARLLEWESVH